MLGKKTFSLSVAIVAMTAGFITPAAASTAAYPTKPITLVVPFPPGGTSDSLARGLAKGMSDRLGVSVVIDNKGGAGTVIGTQHVARSKPDGYTLLWGATPIAINPTLFAELPYNTVKDLTMVSDIAAVPLVLAVNPASKITNLKDLITKLKKDGSNATYGSSGMGGSPHLATALFLHEVGAAATHVPYRGSSPSVSDLVANRTTFVFDTLFMMMPFIESGRITALAQTFPERSPLLPKVPTISESGFPDYHVTSWFSVLAPSATPRDIVNKLNKVMNEVLADPGFSTPYTNQGVKMTGGTAEEAQAHLLAEIETWGKAVKISGAKVE